MFGLSLGEKPFIKNIPFIYNTILYFKDPDFSYFQKGHVMTLKIL